ncbi:MAG: hypothetical protein ACYT04_81295, partial [Nostoc sp.]
KRSDHIQGWMFVLGQRSSLLPITKDLTFYLHNNLVNGALGTCTERSRSIGHWLFFLPSSPHSLLPTPYSPLPLNSGINIFSGLTL